MLKVDKFKCTRCQEHCAYLYRQRQEDIKEVIRMSYVSGHYREGHFRNGKWVSGGYVNSHYRSGIGYVSGLYSTNTTRIDTKAETNLLKDKEKEELQTPQIEIISEMKNGVDDYSYVRALRFFEAYYPYDTEDVHYADVMMSMNQCKTIDELIAVRERLKEKIKIMGSVEILDKLPKDLIDELSKNSNNTSYKHYSLRIEDNLEADVNSCYDENLFRLFKEKKEITEKACGECFVNMTYCTPNSVYKDKIISEARERAGIDVSVLLEEIAKRYREFGEHWNTYKTFKVGMNGYNTAKRAVEDDFEYLKQFNWRLLPRQKSLYSIIDREEIKKREAILLKDREEVKKRELQIKLFKERKEKLEREKIQRMEIERKRERRTNIIITVIVVVLVLAIIIGIGVWLSSLGGTSGDNSALNWIIAFLFILALMKGGKK